MNITRIANATGNIALWALLVMLIAVFSAALAITWVQSDLISVHQHISHSIDEVQSEIARKSDETTRIALSEMRQHQVDDINRRLRAIELKLDVLWQERYDQISTYRKHGE